MDYYNWNTNFSFRDYPSCGKNYFISSRGLIYDMLADSDAVFLMTNKIGVSKRHPNLCIRPIDNNVTFTFYALTMIDRRPNPILEDFIGTLKEVCHQKT